MDTVCPFIKTIVVASPLGAMIESWTSEWAYSRRHEFPPVAEPQI